MDNSRHLFHVPNSRIESQETKLQLKVTDLSHEQNSHLMSDGWATFQLLSFLSCFHQEHNRCIAPPLFWLLAYKPTKINTLTTVYLEGDIYCCSLLDWQHYHWLSTFINHQIQVTSGQKTFELCKKLTSGIRPSNIQIKYSDVLLEALKQSFNNKVDTTNRCEALKEVMSLNYV